MLKLNQNKTQLLIIHPHKVKNIENDININGQQIKVSKSAKSLGVILYSKMDLKVHITAMCKKSFYHLHLIAKENCLDQIKLQSAVEAYVLSHLGFCSTVLYGLPQSALNRVQRVINNAAG